MLDYVIRNARVPGAANGGAGRYRLFERKDRRDRAEACCRLAVLRRAGLPVLRRAVSRPTSISTSRASSTAARRSRAAAIPNHMQRVQAVKPGFTRRGHLQPRQDHAGELHQAGHHAHPHPRRDRSAGRHQVHRGADDAAEGIRLGGRSRNLRLRAGGPRQRCRRPTRRWLRRSRWARPRSAARRTTTPIIAAHINRVFELARQYDIDVDLHIDSGHDPAAMDNMLVAELTEKYKHGGRVAMGHMTKVAALPPDKQKDIARRLADVGAAVTVLPATDLFVLARHRRLRRAALHHRRQPVRRARLQLLDLDQQHPQSVHAVRRLLADPHGQHARQCSAGRDSWTGSRSCSR